MFSRAFWADTCERVAATVAAALVGGGVILDFGNRKTYEVAGAIALATLLKCLAASKVGAPDSASLLPAEVDPPVEP